MPHLHNKDINLRIESNFQILQRNFGKKYDLISQYQRGESKNKQLLNGEYDTLSSNALMTGCVSHHHVI